MLLLSDGGIVKSTKFTSPVYIGDPINTVRLFNEMEADELILVDIEATSQDREPDYSLLEDIANEAFMPMAYAGGLHSSDAAGRVLDIGFEKVGFDSAIHLNPEVVQDVVHARGAQAVVAIVTVNDSGDVRSPQSTDRAASPGLSEHLAVCEKHGVGEVLLYVWQRDGTFEGLNLELTNAAASVLSCPLVIAGGLNSISELSSAVAAGADAVAGGALFCLHGARRGVLVSYPSRREIIECLRS